MHIFSFLDDKTLFGCALVCKRYCIRSLWLYSLIADFVCSFQRLGEDNELWTVHNRKRWKKSKENRVGVIEVQYTERSLSLGLSLSLSPLLTLLRS
jgi:hypothetical protein